MPAVFYAQVLALHDGAWSGLARHGGVESGALTHVHVWSICSDQTWLLRVTPDRITGGKSWATHLRGAPSSADPRQTQTRLDGVTLANLDNQTSTTQQASSTLPPPFLSRTGYGSHVELSEAEAEAAPKLSGECRLGLSLMLSFSP